MERGLISAEYLGWVEMGDPEAQVGFGWWQPYSQSNTGPLNQHDGVMGAVSLESLAKCYIGQLAANLNLQKNTQMFFRMILMNRC